MKGKKSNRTECIYRAIRLVQMFQEQREVTVRHIQDEFDITKQSAQVWLDEMSRVFPVCELRENLVVNRNRVPPMPQKVYGILSI